MKYRETVQKKLEFKMFSEKCFEQAKEECDGIDCAWCDIIECPREVKNDRK